MCRLHGSRIFAPYQSKKIVMDYIYHVYNAIGYGKADLFQRGRGEGVLDVQSN